MFIRRITIKEQKEDFRDAHVAPSFDDRPVDKKIDDAGDFSLAEVAQGFHNQPSDYFSPMGARYYMYRDTAGMESFTAIDNFIRYYKANGIIPNRTVIAYRAVPNDIPLDHLIDGDWITFSKTYATNHGESRFGEGEYKIIKQNVSPYDVWWMVMILGSGDMIVMVGTYDSIF